MRRSGMRSLTFRELLLLADPSRGRLLHIAEYGSQQIHFFCDDNQMQAIKNDERDAR